MTVSSIQQEWRVHPNNCIICETCVSIVVWCAKITRDRETSFFPPFPRACVIGSFVCQSASLSRLRKKCEKKNVDDWQSKNTCYLLLFFLFSPFFNVNERNDCWWLVATVTLGNVKWVSRVDEEDLSSNRDRRLGSYSLRWRESMHTI